MEPTQELIDQLRRDKIEAAKRMTEEQRLAAGGELFDSVVSRMRAGIRMQYGDIEEARVDAILLERLAIARRLESRR